MTLKFAHSSDWQWGMTRHFLRGEAQHRFTEARFDAVRAAGLKAKENGCAFLLAAGDVFDSNLLEPRVVLRGLETLGALAPLPIYILPGNHDPLDAKTIYRSAQFEARRPSNVHVLEVAGAIEVAPGVDLVVAPWTAKTPAGDPVNPVLEGLDERPDRLRILVGHGQVDALSPDKYDPTLIRMDAIEDAVSSGRVKYVALGDRHSTTSVGATGRIWYCGAPEVTDYTEDDPGNVLIVELDQQHIQVRQHHVGTWSFQHRLIEAYNTADIDRIMRDLESISDKSRTVLKLALRGALSMADNHRLEAALDTATTLCAAVERWERHSDLQVVPDAADVDHLGLSGFAHTALERLRAAAQSAEPAQAIEARDALMLLYRLAGGAR